MTDRTDTNADGATDDFARAAEGESGSLVGEVLEFLALNKKWWLLPIIVVLLLVGVLFLVGGAAPFIYTLF